MAITVINTQIKLKRGTAARWVEVNPILAQGEPGFVYDTNQMKIGDGIHHWNELPFIEGKSGVVSYNSFLDFPVVGDDTVIYKATQEKSLYQYNSKTLLYEKLNSGGSSDSPSDVGELASLIQMHSN